MKLVKDVWFLVRLLVLVSELFVVLKVRIIAVQVSTAVLFVTTEASKLPLQGYFCFHCTLTSFH